MKLLFVLPEYGPVARGGIATYYRHLFPALVRAGCQVDVCVAERAQVTPSLVQDGARIISIERAHIDWAPSHLQHLAIAPGLRATLANAFAAWERSGRGLGYDIVEATDWGLLYVPWLLQHSGPPVVVQLHGSNGQVSFHDPFEGCELEDMVTRMLETALLGRADELQSGGRANADEWSRLLCRPVRHIWPALSPETQSVDVGTTHLKQGEFALVVGRIQRWKGPEVLCQAAAMLGGAAPKIFWVGRDHPVQRFDHSMSDHLRKTYPGVWGGPIAAIGERPLAEIAALQAAAKFVVVPSTWDTFNLTAVEAMGAGKVVICSDGAGAADLIEDGKNGFRFPSNDAVKLASLMRFVDEMSAADREPIGLRAQETVLRELDVERICVRRLERYAQVKDAPRQRRGAHPWLDSLFAASVPGPPLAFLDKLPLRQVLRYARSRATERLRTGFR